MAAIIPFYEQNSSKVTQDMFVRLVTMKCIARDIALRLQKDKSYPYRYLLQSNHRCRRFQRWLTHWLNATLLDIGAYRSCEDVVNELYDDIKNHVKINSTRKEKRHGS